MDTSELKTSLSSLERAIAQWLGAEDAEKGAREGGEEKAVWTTAYINDLPDSAFLYVEPGKKDEDGKTVPRSLRHFPVRDAEGNVDLPHLRNALARIPQSNVPQAAKDRATAAAQRMLEEAKKSENLSWPEDLATKEFRAGIEKKVDELRDWGPDPWAPRR